MKNRDIENIASSVKLIQWPNEIILLTLFGITLITILGLHIYSQRKRSITLQLGPSTGMNTKLTIIAPSTSERSLRHNIS